MRQTANKETASAAPRLRIAYLFLWMACTALALGAGRRAAGELSGMRAVVWVFQAAGVGAGLSALFLWPAWRLRGIRFPHAPGDWLLLATSIATVLDLMLGIVTLELDHRGVLVEYTHWSGDVRQLVWALAFVAPAVFVKLRLWRAFFALVAVEYGTRILTTVLYNYVSPTAAWWIGGFSICIALAETCLLPAAIVVDLVRHRHYPWTHWTGIVVYYAIVGLTMLNYVSFR